MNVLIVYYSLYGHVAAMAQAVAEGVHQVAGVNATPRRVPETLSPEILQKLHATEAQNTLADLDWLRETGLAAGLAALAAEGKTEIVGICAGLQMLGQLVADPLGLESGRGREAGLGLLAIATELAAQKTQAATRAVHAPTGLRLAGYEIHHGLTKLTADRDAPVVTITREDGSAMGYARPDGHVWGAYLHGLFDADAFRRHFLDGLRVRRGLAPIERTTPYDLEPALERLADVLEAHLDIPALLRPFGV